MIKRTQWDSSPWYPLRRRADFPRGSAHRIRTYTPQLQRLGCCHYTRAECEVFRFTASSRQYSVPRRALISRVEPNGGGNSPPRRAAIHSQAKETSWVALRAKPVPCVAWPVRFAYAQGFRAGLAHSHRTVSLCAEPGSSFTPVATVRETRGQRYACGNAPSPGRRTHDGFCA